MKGPKRKPTALKKLDGNPGRRPLNDQEPKYPPINAENELPPPAVLTGPAKKEWTRLTTLLGEVGLLQQTDQTALMLYCQAFGDWLKEQELVAEQGSVVPGVRGGLIINPHVKLSQQAEERMRFYLTEFGLTPSSRSKLKVDRPGGEDDDLAKILNRKKKGER